MDDLVSVIVTVYNSEKYISNAIKSIIDQTYKNLEIIVVDDGSEDASLDICYKYEEVDSRIKVFHKINEGVSSARNFGLRKSTGRYICFLDSDDYYSKDFVLLMVNKQKENKSELVVCGYSTTKEQRMILDSTKVSNEKKLNEIIDKGCLNVVWNKLFIKDCIKQLFDEKLKIN